MVAERTVIRVLLHRHDLHTVIAEFGDTRQYVAAELLIRVHFLLRRTHAYVALVNKEGFLFALNLSPFALMFPDIRLLVPYLRGEDLRLLVLYDAAYVTRYALAVAALPFDEELV